MSGKAEMPNIQHYYLPQMKKQVYTYQKDFSLQNSQLPPIVLSLSRYTDSLLIFLNQTGAIGSILQGEAAQSTAEMAEEQWDPSGKKAEWSYDIRVLFGSTEIQFYELLLRRVMGIIWEQMGGNLSRVIFNVSLPVLHPAFKQEEYYALLVQQCSEALKAVI